MPAESAPPVVSVPIEGSRGADESLQAGVEKERGAVADDRPAQGDRQLFGREVHGPLARRVVSRERLVLEVAGDRALPAVRARAGHRVHQPAGEVAVANVERGDQDLQLLHRLDRQGPNAAGGARACRSPRGRGCRPGPTLLAPSIWKPLSRSDCPAIEMPASRRQGRLRREQDEPGEILATAAGRFETIAPEIVWAGPVRPEFSRSSCSAVTVSSASWVTAEDRTRSTRCRSPSERVMPARRPGVKPMARASIEYGPPTERYSNA